MSNNPILSRGKIIKYFTADIAKGLFNGMIGNYLLYFYQPTVKSGLPSMLSGNKLLGFITVMALLTGLSKVVDAVTDPLVANLSDKCKSPKGRRMPFMRAAAVPYALCVLMIFYAPFTLGSAGNAVWVGFFLISYYIFYTLYFIPHRALVPEVIPDPKDRVGYYAVSTVFFMGSSAVMYAATLFVSWLKNAGLAPVWAWRVVFTVFAAAGLCCLLVSAFAFDEKKYLKGSHKPEDGIFKAFATVFKNKNFVIFTLGDLASYISMAFFQTTMLYYITVLINVAEAKAFYIMLAAIITAIACFPLIIKISKKYNKKTPMIIAAWMFTFLFAAIFFGDNIAALVPGRELVIGICVAYPFAAINILPQAVLSDIIQADSLKTGINREGIYSASKTFIEKIAYAVALVIVSSVLTIGAPAGEEVGMMGIKLTGLIAGVFSLLSAVFYMLYNDRSVTRNIKENSVAIGESDMYDTDTVAELIA